MGENRGVNGVEGFVRHGDGLLGENGCSTSVYIQLLSSGATGFSHCILPLQCQPRGRRVGARQIADGRKGKHEAVERRIKPARYLCDGDSIR
jgi:hypothetical protein